MSLIPGLKRVWTLKKFVKKLIFEVELRNETVLDELYEQCGFYMSSLKVIKNYA